MKSNEDEIIFHINNTNLYMSLTTGVNCRQTWLSHCYKFWYRFDTFDLLLFNMGSMKWFCWKWYATITKSPAPACKFFILSGSFQAPISQTFFLQVISALIFIEIESGKQGPRLCFRTSYNIIVPSMTVVKCYSTIPNTSFFNNS